MYSFTITIVVNGVKSRLTLNEHGIIGIKSMSSVSFLVFSKSEGLSHFGSLLCNPCLISILFKMIL